jgi:hypothetical protein
MRKTALLICGASFLLAGAAVAQNVGTPNTPAAAASAAAGTAIQAIQLPAAQGSTQAQSSPAGSQQASQAACNADAQKFCSGKETSERLQCLNENKAALTAACRATIGSPPPN